MSFFNRSQRLATPRKKLRGNQKKVTIADPVKLSKPIGLPDLDAVADFAVSFVKRTILTLFWAPLLMLRSDWPNRFAREIRSGNIFTWPWAVAVGAFIYHYFFSLADPFGVESVFHIYQSGISLDRLARPLAIAFVGAILSILVLLAATAIKTHDIAPALASGAAVLFTTTLILRLAVWTIFFDPESSESAYLLSLKIILLFSAFTCAAPTFRAVRGKFTNSNVSWVWASAILVACIGYGATFLLVKVSFAAQNKSAEIFEKTLVTSDNDINLLPLDVVCSEVAPGLLNDHDKTEYSCVLPLVQQSKIGVLFSIKELGFGPELFSVEIRYANNGAVRRRFFIVPDEYAKRISPLDESLHKLSGGVGAVLGSPLMDAQPSKAVTLVIRFPLSEACKTVLKNEFDRNDGRWYVRGFLQNVSRTPILLGGWKPPDSLLAKCHTK